MLSLFGKFLGKVPLQLPSPQPNFITQFNPTRGFSVGIGTVASRVGDKRNILDFHRRQLVAKHELRRNIYKAMWRDTTLPEKMREQARYKLSKLPRNSSFTRVRNRCIFTGRARGVYTKFRMSRICFRERATQGELMGVQKASW